MTTIDKVVRVDMIDISIRKGPLLGSSHQGHFSFKLKITRGHWHHLHLPSLWSDTRRYLRSR